MSWGVQTVAVPRQPIETLPYWQNNNPLYCPLKWSKRREQHLSAHYFE
jgi:hypothetical protein